MSLNDIFSDVIVFLVIVIGTGALVYDNIQLNHKYADLYGNYTELRLENMQYERNEAILVNWTQKLSERNGDLQHQFSTIADIRATPENIRLGEYNLSFIDICGFDRNENGTILMNEMGVNRCAGWTNGNGTIFIKNNRSVSDIIETCNHEILHNIVGIFNLSEEEEVVERIDNLVMSKECAILDVELRRGELE